MKFRALTTNERAETPGFTHVGIITADDLTTTTVTVVQTITFCALAAGDQVLRVMWHLKTPFQNTADATNDSTTVSVGDTALVTTHLTAGQANLNGTEVIWRATNTAVLYTAADVFTATITPKTASAVSVINRGELLIYVSLARVRYVSEAMSATPIAKT
jgi:hypothetical protein